VLSHAHTFFAGAWLACVISWRHAAEKPPLLCNWVASAAALCLLALFLSLPLYMNGFPLYSAQALASPASWLAVETHYWGSELLPSLPLGALLVLGLVEGDRLGTLLSRWPLTLGKELALGVYLLQHPVFNQAELLFPQLKQASNRWISLAALVVAAALVQVCVQRPAGTFVNSLLAKPRPPPPPASPAPAEPAPSADATKASAGVAAIA